MVLFLDNELRTTRVMLWQAGGRLTYRRCLACDEMSLVASEKLDKYLGNRRTLNATVRHKIWERGKRAKLFMILNRTVVSTMTASFLCAVYFATLPVTQTI
jgi:hypothetical protein